MNRFRLTRAALNDVKGIGRYTEQQFGPEQRNAYLQQMDRAFHDLAEQPALGRSAEEIRAGYRRWQVGSHVIFYRPISPAGIEIVRVLHQSMDVPGQL